MAHPRCIGILLWQSLHVSARPCAFCDSIAIRISPWLSSNQSYRFPLGTVPNRSSIRQQLANTWKCLVQGVAVRLRGAIALLIV